MARIPLEQSIHDRLHHYMKEGNSVAANILRIVITELANASVLKNREDLTEADVVNVLKKLGKRAQDAIQQYEIAGRIDLVAEETAQLAVLKEFLPEELSAEQVAALVDQAIVETKATSIQDMGKVMGRAMGLVQGRADGSIVSQLVKEKLSA